MFKYKFLSVLAHKFTNMSVENIAGEKNNTKQEPEGRHKIDLPYLKKKKNNSHLNYQMTRANSTIIFST